MEKSFIVSKESKYFKDFEDYKNKEIQQKDFVRQFCDDNNIEASQYYIGGDGFVNQPFEECDKDYIRFAIIPTKNDLQNFSKMLKKPDKYGLYGFKKNSKIAKEFAQKCIDKKIIINLSRLSAGDYFKSIGFFGCGYQQFTYKDIMYLKVESERLKKDDIPDGFTEIKLSEYHRALEKFEEENKVIK